MAFIKMFAIFVLIFFVIVFLVKKNTPPGKFHSEDAHATSNYINVKNSEVRLQKNEITQKNE